MSNLRALSFQDFYEAVTDKNPYARFFKSVQLSHAQDILCYLQYLPARHVMVARGGKGLGSFENLGIDLASDKKFDFNKLKDLSNFELLKDFVEGALERSHFVAETVEYKNEPLGVMLLASHRPLQRENFDTNWTRAMEFIASHRLLLRRIEKFDQFDPDTEVLNPLGFQSQLQKEIVRARRLKLPVSTILFSVDRYQQLASSMNGIQRKNWMHALAKLLKSKSRVNDLVGRIDEGVFMVALPHTPLEGARSKAGKLAKMIAEAKLKVGGKVLKFTVSSVINEYPRVSADADELVSKSMDMISSIGSGTNQMKAAGVRAHFQPDFDVES